MNSCRSAHVRAHGSNRTRSVRVKTIQVNGPSGDRMSAARSGGGLDLYRGYNIGTDRGSGNCEIAADGKGQRLITVGARAVPGANEYGAGADVHPNTCIDFA